MSIHPRDECPAVYAISVLCHVFTVTEVFHQNASFMLYFCLTTIPVWCFANQNPLYSHDIAETNFNSVDAKAA